MPLAKDEFVQKWKKAGEDSSPLIVDTAWRRYQHVQSPDYQTKPESSDPSLDDLKAAFDEVLSHPELKQYVASYKFLSIAAGDLPWRATGVVIAEDQPVSVFPAGRTWRSRLLDLYLLPQFNLWYRIGINGDVFNSTRDTRTFKCIPGQSGELYLACQHPGQFSSRSGGRLQNNLAAYDKVEGVFNTLIIQWQQGLGVRGDINNLFAIMDSICEGRGQPDPYGLISTGRARLMSDYFAHQFPLGWTLLWFLGVSEIFTQEEATSEASSHEQAKSYISAGTQQNMALLSPQTEQPATDPVTPGAEFLLQTRSQAPAPMIRALPDHNVGILQQDLAPVSRFTPATSVTWSWSILSLPSRLREDTTLTHDYLSLAFEFENGRDLSYTWSWELPVNFGYWCPLANWCDREYHIVIRSGTQDLGKWIDEKRNLYRDYIEYVNEGDETRKVPEQLVRVWLIAGNRWQRYRGEMLIKGIVIKEESGEGESDERVIL